MTRLIIAALISAAPVLAAAHTGPVGTVAEMQGVTPVKLAFSAPVQHPGKGVCPMPSDDTRTVLIACATN